MFDLIVITPQKTIFNDAVKNLWVEGNDSEYELLSFHAHLVGLIRNRIIIDKERVINFKKGAVRFYENKCVVMIEADVRAIPKAT